MANIDKRGEKWRAEVCINYRRQSKTFKTKREAVQWANEKEQDGISEGHTLRQALEEYKPIAESHKGGASELSRINAMLEHMDCIDSKLEFLSPAMLTTYREKRLKMVAPVSVRRELIILGAMFRLAVDEWGWLKESPLKTVRKPVASPARRRGIAQAEIDAISKELESMRVGKQVGAMFALSLETGMRLSELISLRWEDVSEKKVVLRDTKNGDRREVPLSVKAREVIASRRDIDPATVFTLTPHVASKTFQRARDAAGHPDVHFHDARSEAITRLSKKLDVMQLARIIGHRDLKSLMFYYAESADDMADKL